MYLLPATSQPLSGMGRRRRGLGATVSLPLLSLRSAVQLRANPFPNGVPVASGGPVSASPYLNQPSATPIPSPTASTSVYAGTPVPSNYPTNQFFVNSDGSVWEYSAASGTWIDTGTPYNVGAGAASAAPAASSGAVAAPAASTTTTAVSTDGTPVPAGFPTNQEYTASDGSLWLFNAATGTWQYAGISSGAASGSAATTAEGDVQSLLQWFSQSTLISGVPNWALAAVAGVIALKFMQPAKAGR
jgi:hypothetical protein